MNRRVIVLALLIVALGLCLRLYALHKIWALPLTNDSLDYDSIAWNLVQGKGYKMWYGPDAHYTAFRGPSYVLYLAGIYKLTHHSVHVAQFGQILLDMLTGFFLFKTCLLFFKRYDIALLSGFLYAAYPPFWTHAPEVVSEPFAGLAVMLSIYAGLVFYSEGRKGLLIACALAVALGGLSKPVVLLLPFILAIAAWGVTKSTKRLVALPVVCVLVTTVFFVPWWVRNNNVFHHFVPTLLSGGVTFWGGTGPNNGEVVTSTRVADLPPQVQKAAENMDEYQLDKFLYQEGFKVIKSNPRRYAKLVVRKILLLWFGHVFEGNHEGKGPALLSLMIVALTIFGVRVAKPAASAVRLLVLLALYYTALHTVYFAQVRYMFPVVAFMFIFCAAGLVLAFDAKSRRGPAVAGAAA